MAYKGKRKWLKKDEHEQVCDSTNFEVVKSWKMGSEKKLIHGGRVASLTVTIYKCLDCGKSFREYQKRRI